MSIFEDPPSDVCDLLILYEAYDLDRLSVHSLPFPFQDLRSFFSSVQAFVYLPRIWIRSSLLHAA